MGLRRALAGEGLQAFVQFSAVAHAEKVSTPLLVLRVADRDGDLIRRAREVGRHWQSDDATGRPAIGPNGALIVAEAIRTEG